MSEEHMVSDAHIKQKKTQIILVIQLELTRQ